MLYIDIVLFTKFYIESGLTFRQLIFSNSLLSIVIVKVVSSAQRLSIEVANPIRRFFHILGPDDDQVKLVSSLSRI